VIPGINLAGTDSDNRIPRMVVFGPKKYMSFICGRPSGTSLALRGPQPPQANRFFCPDTFTTVYFDTFLRTCRACSTRCHPATTALLISGSNFEAASDCQHLSDLQRSSEWIGDAITNGLHHIFIMQGL
jgi:hypothetical protein